MSLAWVQNIINSRPAAFAMPSENNRQLEIDSRKDKKNKAHLPGL
jgi:hypothetical protein